MLAKARSTFMARGTASGTPMPPRANTTPLGALTSQRTFGNKELIKKKAKKNKGLQRKVWIQKVREWHQQGEPDLGWGEPAGAPGSI